jgi:hypothetical protein
MNNVQLVLLLFLVPSWLFIGLGFAMNLHSWWIGIHAKQGERVPSSVFLIFGILGSLLAYNTIVWISKYFAVIVSWPWVWVALPLIIDLYCLGHFIYARRDGTNGS